MVVDQLWDDDELFEEPSEGFEQHKTASEVAERIPVHAAIPSVSSGRLVFAACNNS